MWLDCWHGHRSLSTTTGVNAEYHTALLTNLETIYAHPLFENIQNEDRGGGGLCGHRPLAWAVHTRPSGETHKTKYKMWRLSFWVTPGRARGDQSRKPGAFPPVIEMF